MISRRGTHCLKVLLVFIALGCDGMQENVVELNNAPQTLIGEEDPVGGEAIESETDDGPTGPVEAQWLDVSGSEVTGLSTLQLKIHNVSQFEVKVTADIACEGFINHRGTRPLVPHTQTLDVDEEVIFSLAANKFPIQNITGASQFTAQVRVQLKEGAVGFSSYEYLVVTAPVLYRHDASFQTLSVFDMETLINTYGGIIAGNPNKDTPGNVVGRIMDISNSVEELTESDIMIDLPEGDGVIHGTVDALAVEIEMDGPAGEEVPDAF